MKRIYLNLFISIIFIILILQATGQEQKADSVKVVAGVELKQPTEAKNRKNTILINVTNPSLISNRFFTLAYERMLPNSQSFSVSLGSFSVPKFINIADSLGVDTNTKEKGFHFSGDYRFYLKNLNKHDAPRGVYIGPYYAYNYLNRGVTWNLDGTNFNGQVDTDLKLNIHTIGFELGYQFVFWDRLAVDMILFGPGFGSYKLSTVLKTSLTPDAESEFFEKLNNYLEQRWPGYEWIIEPGEFKKNGSFKTWELGYRYTIRVGFRF